ncbi:hypothetical protein Glove_117g470 [Diversispora epigaea]|uniref:Uncharacterized protein n=1 Tax=Diversispora epigaea TaxID=1348612 RepID=A0A397J099_9GLOM|nr:hypothetical protein Glove_117g470 [Diversispora epigaea]
MLSRLFLISTLVIVGITTVAIGATVTETIEVIKAVKIPQMGSDLNRRFIVGIPGLPQCPDSRWPQLLFSYCVGPKKLYSCCRNPNDPTTDTKYILTCPETTTCMNFVTDFGSAPGPEFNNFAICIDDETLKSFKNDDHDGIFCKTYEINGVTGDKATLSFEIYDANSNPAKVRNVFFTSGSQSGGHQNTNNYSSIINCKNGQKIKVCMDAIYYGITLYATFTFLDGTYGNSNG